MKIVVTDGYTLNPGDLDWSPLEAFGHLEVYGHTPDELVLERLSGAQIALINKVRLDRERLSALPDLRYVGVNATGYNVIDVDAAKKQGVVVTNVPAYGTSSVAQHTFALLLELTNSVALHSDSVHAGDWSRSRDWCYWLRPQIELSGLTLGIFGLGNIGSAVARIGTAFGMRVIAVTRKGGCDGVERVSEEALLSEADVLSLHAPLTPETDKWLNSDKICKMKRTAFLLNTSRGGLVDDQALADALNEGRLAGASLDVLSIEPPPPTNPLLSAKNCVVTPHLAWATTAARQRLLDIAVENVRAFLQGSPQNVVS